MRAFEVLDKEGEGCVSIDDLKHLLTRLGDKLTIENFNEMISDIDTSDGNIDYRELVRIMMSK